MSSQITVNQNQINFLSSGTSVSSLLSSNSNLYLNTDSGNFYFTSFKNTTSNVTCDKLTTTTLTPLSVNATNITANSFTISNMQVTNFTTTNISATNITTSNLVTNIIARTTPSNVTLTANVATTVYQMDSIDAGLLYFYWFNGYAALTYCWISNTTSPFITQISNSQASNPITFTSTAGGAIQATCSASVGMAVVQLKFI